MPPPLPVPEELLGASRDPDVVTVPARRVVAVDGAGPPEAPGFKAAIGALYGVAYGLKFARKRGRAGGDFRIGPLEGRWWAEGEGLPAGMLTAPRESWRWRLRLAVPPDVEQAEVDAVAEAARSRRGGKLFGSEQVGRVFVERLPAARMGRVLHVGPYADEPATFERLRVVLERVGLRRTRPHVEVYLSDPRRTATARLRTILLVELEG